MTVTTVERDVEGLGLTLIAEFDATVDRVWELWADPRQLERWWGPPGHPATVEEHDLTPGGAVSYLIGGPDGEEHRGWWRISSVGPPTSLDFTDGFADGEGAPIADMPITTVSMRLTERDGLTRMELRSVFASREAMERLMEMGTDEGLRLAVGQMDALLAA